MLVSTTSIESRTRSTVCWRVITPARARGAAPKTEAASALPPGPAGRRRWRYQSTKPRMPACTIMPDPGPVLGAELAEPRHVGSIRAIAAVLSAPVARCSASAARSCGVEAGA